MQADWTVACGADDPMVVVPWGGDGGSAGKIKSIRYIDLRGTPDAILEIPEAVGYSTLAAALRRWNQPDTSLFTAKCDVWEYPARFFDAEDLPGFAYAHASYVDLLSMERQMFSSFAACERQLHAWTEIARSIPLPASRCDCTLRPARILPTAAASSAVGTAINLPLDGFATSLYVWGYGSTPQAAASVWTATLEALIEPLLLLRVTRASTE